MVRGITSLAPQAEGDLAKLLALPLSGETASVGLRQGDGGHHRREHERARTADASVKEGIVTDYAQQGRHGLGKIGVLVAIESKATRPRSPRWAASLRSTSGRKPRCGKREGTRSGAGGARACGFTPSRPKLRERAPTSSPRWWRAGCARSSTAGSAPAANLPGAGGGKATVEQVLKDAEKTAGAPIEVAKFVRYALGEGIDKKEGDFAAEVAAAVGKR